MTVCERTQEEMKAYMDGELRWPARLSVQRHLSSCSGCRRELAEMQQIQVQLRASDPGELPDALRSRIIALCAEIAPPSESPRKRLDRYAVRPSLALGALGVAVILGFAVLPRLNAPLLHETNDRTTEFGTYGDGAVPEKSSGDRSRGPLGLETGPSPAEKSAANSAAKSAASPVATSAPKSATKSATTPNLSIQAGAGVAFEPRRAARTHYNFSTAADGLATNAPPAATISPMASNRASLSEQDRRPELEALVKKPTTLSTAAAVPPAGQMKDVRLFAEGARNLNLPGSTPLGDSLRLPETKAVEEKRAADLIVAVDDVAQKSAIIVNAARLAGGSVARQEQGVSLAYGECLTIDIPVSKVEETVEQIKKQGEVVSENRSGMDGALGLRSLSAGISETADRYQRGGAVDNSKVRAKVSDAEKAKRDEAATKVERLAGRLESAAGPRPNAERPTAPGGANYFGANARRQQSNTQIQNGGLGRNSNQQPGGFGGGGGGFGVPAQALQNTPGDRKSDNGVVDQSVTAKAVNRARKSEPVRDDRLSGTANAASGKKEASERENYLSKGLSQKQGLADLNQLELQKESKLNSANLFYLYRQPQAGGAVWARINVRLLQKPAQPAGPLGGQKKP